MKSNRFLIRILRPLLLGAVAMGGNLLVTGDARGNGAARVLPHAEGRNFETLDAYLAHLRELGKMGIAWYERQPDGRYRLIRRSRPGTAPEIFTREELQERFGFDD